ncbi:MAG: hypothetical protein COV48_16810 [Elusimicrobia bacterium CG11_big_fil_rev_8_21_14_0_20_64_6]|nr:MAG: hypothetical protein COV48_16810 [Elusimicrobia bacterium CG11_big_fil_rev_8_21_14_0_20_64_6]
MKNTDKLDLPPLALPALIVGTFVVLSTIEPRLCVSLAREDYWVEWLSFAAFLVAGICFAREAVRRGLREGWFVAGLGLFCLFIAFEEISWAQRIFGVTPPKIFLVGNYQQEFNFHNFLKPYLSSEWQAALILIGWGVLFSLAPLHLRLREELAARRVVTPALSLIPWSVIGLLMLGIYPVLFTGEYVELLIGALFLAQAMSFLATPGRRAVLILATVAVGAAGMGLTQSIARWAAPQKTACAHLETRALADAVAGAATGRHERFSGVDKRLYTGIQQRYLKPEIARALLPIACPSVTKDPDRRAYFLDPWGQAYWIRFTRNSSDEDFSTTVYSFGPNRRRDGGDEGASDRDDISQTRILAPRASPEEDDDAGPEITLE